MKWQPIEKAPYNEPILIYDGKMICVAVKRIWDKQIYWECVGATGYEFENDFNAPTHWMPLPDPPEAD